MSQPVARHLLAGALAVHNDLISRDQLLAGLRAWVLRKETPLEDLLVEQGVISGQTRLTLQALTATHLKLHNNQPGQSLQSLSSLDNLWPEMQGVADADVQASLSGWIGRPFRGGADPEQPRAGLGSAGLPDSGSADSGTEAPRFRVLRPHAKGGLGEVFVAEDIELRREVALKEIQSRHARNTDSRSRFLLEAEITGALEHPGIVPVYGLGRHADGRPFYAMRFIEGETLKEAIDRFHEAHAGARDLTVGGVGVEFRKLLGRFLAVCQAIAYAHFRGVLHRDLKPGNIMLGRHGETLVVDWGLAKVLGGSDVERAPSGATPESPARTGPASTRVGSTLGTPVYMSPEQAAGRIDELGPATDIYSLGATLYQLLTGQPPFAGRNATEIMRRVQAGDFSRPSDLLIRGTPSGSTPQAGGQSRGGDAAGGRAGRGRPLRLPPALEAICLKAMAREPGDRYASVTALTDDLERFLADEPVSAHVEPVSDRVRRWTRKHRTAVGTLTATVLVATAALGLLTAVTTRNNAILTAANNRISLQSAQIERQNEDLQQSVATLEAANTRINAQATQIQRQFTELQQSTAAERQAKAVAEEERLRAEINARKSNTNAEAARRNRYHGQMNLAASNWDLKRTAETAELLAQFAPGTPDADLRGFEWHYLDRLLHSELDLLDHEPHRSVDLLFTPEGSRLILSDPAGQVRVWDVATGADPLQLNPAVPNLSGLSVSPDGRWLSAYGFGRGHVWNLATGEALHSLPQPPTGSHTLAAVFSRDGSRLTTIGTDDVIERWDLKRGQRGSPLQRSTTDWQQVVVSPSGEWAVALTAGSGAKLLRMDNGRTVAEFQPDKPRELLQHVEFSPDSQWVALAQTSAVRLWNLQTGRLTATLPDQVGVRCLKFDSNGSRLATMESGSSVIRLWDPAKGSELGRIVSETPFLAFGFSPVGELLAASSTTHDITLWSWLNGACLATLRGHTQRILDLRFSPDGARLASSSEDRTTRVWDVHSAATPGAATSTFAGKSFAFAPSGDRGAFCDFDKVVVTDLVSGLPVRQFHRAQASWRCLALSPDGTWLAAADSRNTISLWSLANPSDTPLVLDGHTDDVTDLAFHPNGQLLASASSDQTVKLWDLATGQVTATLQADPDGVTQIAFSPDGTHLASAGSSRPIAIWNVASGQEILRLSGDAALASSVAFNHDGRLLATAGNDAHVQLWDAVSGAPVAVLRGHSGTVTSVGFSPDGSRLVSGSDDHTAKLWEVGSGQMLLNVPLEQGVKAVSFSQSGHLLAIESNLSKVRILDARPRTPQLRERQQALCLINLILSQVGSEQELKRAVARSTSFTPEVRKLALELAPAAWRRQTSLP